MAFCQSPLAIGYHDDKKRTHVPKICYHQNYKISVFFVFSIWRRAAILDFQIAVLTVVITSLGICHIFEVTKIVLLFNIPWLARKLRFLLEFRKSKMAVGRHLEDDFKIKIWYQKWNQWCWNIWKIYFTLIHPIKIS